MKKKLILIALCSALVFGVTACTGDEMGDIASDAGEMASDIMEGAGDMISDAADGVGDAASDLTDNAENVVSGTESGLGIGDDNDGQDPWVNTYSDVERTTSDVASDANAASSSNVQSSGAGQALSALQSGNQVYRDGAANMDVSASLRSDLASNGQNPHTIVISCSDSRVPPELVFNSSLGDLFVIRTAGNVVGDYELGSVEYAAEHLGSPLLLVMGHSSCGAVDAAVEGEADGNIASIVKEIAPSVAKAKESESDSGKIKDKAEDLNVKNTIANLRKSETISKLESEGKLTIKGAKYDIKTGEVTIFDD